MLKPSAKPSRLVLVALTYAAAIVAAGFVSPPSWLLLGGGVLALVAIRPLSRRDLGGWAVLIGVFLLGMLAAPVSMRPARNDISRHAGKWAEVTGRVVSLPALGKSGGRLVLQVESARIDGREVPATGKLQVFLPAESLPDLGDRLQLSGLLRTPIPPTNPGQFSYGDYLARQRVFALLRVKSTKDLRPLGPARGIYAIQRWASSARGAMLRVIERSVPPEQATLVGSMVFGIQAVRVPEETEVDFRNSGTIHVLVVSGSQVVALVIMLLWLFRRVMTPPKLSAAVIFGMVFFYALMTGSGSSVLRAAVVGSLGALGVGISRETEKWTLVSAAALFVLALNPMALREIGFQLTFAAVIGILALAGPIYRRILPPPDGPPKPRSLLSRGIGYVAMLFAVSLSAQLTTTPIIAYYFQEFAPLGVIANLVAVPLSELLVPLGIVTSAAGALWMPLGKVLGAVDAGVVRILTGWVQILAHLPGAHWALPPIPVEAVIGWYLLLGLAAWRPRAMTRERWALVGAGLVLVPVILWGFHPALRGPLRVYFLDVGKGRAALIRTPAGRSILVDGGGRTPFRDSGERVVLPAMKALGIGKLDLLVATSGDNSHAGGLLAVAKATSVKLALLPPSGRGLSELRRTLEGQLVPIRRAAPGQTIDFEDGTRIEILSATSEGPVTLRLRDRDASVLLSGDIDAPSARNLLQANVNLAAGAVQMEWRGEAAPEAGQLARAVSPKVAISCQEGDSPLLTALDALGARVYFTARDGAVILESDGKQMRVRTMLSTGGEKQSAH